MKFPKSARSTVAARVLAGMCGQGHAGRDVRAGICRQGRAGRDVQAGMCGQGCAGRDVKEAPCRQRCVGRDVRAGMCRQRCAGRDVWAGMCRQRWHLPSPCGEALSRGLAARGGRRGCRPPGEEDPPSASAVPTGGSPLVSRMALTVSHLAATRAETRV